MNKKTCMAALVGLAMVQMAAAQAPQKDEKAEAAPEVKATTGSDATRFAGDVLTPRVGLRGKTYKLGLGLDPNGDTVCVPRGSKLRGGDSVSTDGGSLSLVTVETLGTDAQSCGSEKKAEEGQLLAADPEALGSALVSRRGWTYGTLIVPYKYQIKGDRSLSGGATLGGYFGWRQTAWGTGLQYVVFGGATKVDVPKTDAQGAVTTESLAGLSYGVGILGTLKNDFKLGLVVGTDRVSKSAGYVNNGKPWISLSLGVDFTQ